MKMDALYTSVVCVEEKIVTVVREMQDPELQVF